MDEDDTAGQWHAKQDQTVGLGLMEDAMRYVRDTYGIGHRDIGLVRYKDAHRDNGVMFTKAGAAVERLKERRGDK